MAKPIDCKCEYCGTSFKIHAYLFKQGRGRFCSLACLNLSQAVPIEVRFHRRLPPPNERGCIIWPGKLDINGYAMIKEGGQDSRWLKASRVAYRLVHGKFDESLHVLHDCDTPACVTAEHLFLGTAADNVADKMRKGRQTKGEDVHNSKLKVKDVRKIRRLYATTDMTQLAIAKQFDVSDGLIGMVVRREIWTHIT